MARLLGCAYAAIGTLLAQQVAPLALVHMPAAWGYTLTAECSWKPRHWTAVLGPNPPAAPRPDPTTRKAAWTCQHHRGLKSLVIFGAQLQDTWPTASTLAKWEAEDAQKPTPLHPDWVLAPEHD